MPVDISFSSESSSVSGVTDSGAVDATTEAAVRAGGGVTADGFVFVTGALRSTIGTTVRLNHVVLL